MKRAQSLDFFSSPNLKRSTLASPLDSYRPSPVAVSELRFQEREIRDFHYRFLEIIQNIVHLSLRRAEISKQMSNVVLGPMPDGIYPPCNIDFISLNQIITKKLKDYALIASTELRQHPRLHFLNTLVQLPEKDLWIKLLELDESKRVKMSSFLLEPKAEVISSFELDSSLFTFFQRLTEAPEPARKFYRILLSVEGETYETSMDCLRQPEKSHEYVTQEMIKLEHEKNQLGNEIIILFHALRQKDEAYLLRLEDLTRNLFDLLATYPKGIEFESSWSDVSLQLFDNIQFLVDKARLIELLSLEANLKLRLERREIKSKKEEVYGYFIDFTATEYSSHAWMKVDNGRSFGYFQGPFSHLLALNYVLSFIQEKTACFKVYAIQ